MSRLIAFVLGAMLLVGCSTVRVYESVDPSAKTITVPPGGGLTGAIKQGLAKDGWKIIVYRGPQVTQGTTGDQTRLERFNTFNTRYALFVTWRQFDVCMFQGPFDPAYAYDISVVDNQTSQEVLTVSGRGCEGAIVEKLRGALNTPKGS